MLQKPLYTLLIAATALMVSACEPDQSAQQTSQDSGASVTETRFSVAGIDDAQAVSDFLASLQKSVAADDREAVVAMIAYPFFTYDGGQLIKAYPDTETVLEDYDMLFNDQVKTEIAKATVDSLFVNMKGVMIGQGQIWFNLIDGELKIITVQSIN